MREPLRIRDIRNVGRQYKEEILKEQRKIGRDILEKIDETFSKTVTVIFSETRKIRQEIGYQTMMLKILEDNISEILFDKDTGVSTKIEVSVGGEIFGTGAKWILDIDTSKVAYSGILKAIQLVPGIPNKVKELAKSKIERLSQSHPPRP